MNAGPQMFQYEESKACRREVLLHLFFFFNIYVERCSIVIACFLYSYFVPTTEDNDCQKYHGNNNENCSLIHITP